MAPVLRRARGHSPDDLMIAQTVRRVRGWLRSLFRRDVVELEMSDEMQLHLERAAERLMARGMSAADARAEARREFGNVGVIQEEARDARGVRSSPKLWDDLRYSLRALDSRAGVHHLGRARAGARNRRIDGRVQRGRRRAPRAPAVPERRPARSHLRAELADESLDALGRRRAGDRKTRPQLLGRRSASRKWRYRRGWTRRRATWRPDT